MAQDHSSHSEVLKTTGPERWVCRYCHKSFDNVSALMAHKRANPWQDYAIIKRSTGAIECTICHEQFKNAAAFLGHWDDNHESYVEERALLIPPKRKKVDWVIRPMEEELIKHNLRSDKAYAALRNDIVVNELVMAEIEHGVEHEAMTVVEIVGIPGAGKSVFALTLARLIQMKWLDKIIRLYKEGRIREPYTPKIYIGFDLATTLQHLQHARMGDIIIQDEDPEMMGAHSGSSKSQIENVMKIMRKACINFIFVSPVSTPYINMPNLVFEVIYKNTDLRQTRAALYDRKYHAAGWVIMRVLDADDPLMKSYEAMKDANIELIKMSGGRRSVSISEEQVLADMHKLLEYLKRINYNFAKRRHSLADMIEYASMAGVEGNTQYQRMVARSVLDYINSRAAELMGLEEAETMTQAGKYLFIKEREYDDLDFLRVMYDSVDEALASIKSRSAKNPGESPLRKFQKVHADAWFDYYSTGQSYDSVGNKYGVSGQAIANSYENHGYCAIFQEEIQGECAEIALRKKYLTDYKNVGGFGEPDLVKIDNPDGDWVEVKCFQRLSRRLEDLIAKFEYKFIDDGGIMRLALITYKKQECKIRIYRVVRNPDFDDDIDEEEVVGASIDSLLNV